MIDIDALTNQQLDRLAERLAYRVDQRKGEREAAERAKRDTSSLRPHIGDAGTTFGNELARRNWDKECIAALARQTVPFAVAPGTSMLCRDGSRLTGGQELRPLEHLDALQGSHAIQVQRLVKQGFVLARPDAWRLLGVEP